MQESGKKSADTGEYTDKKLCFKCKKQGHQKKDCPEMKKKETSMFISDFAGVLDECYDCAEENCAEVGDAMTDLFLPGTFNKENSS